MVKGYYLHLWYHPLLFHNIKATPANHSIIEEVNELLAKDAIEPSTVGAGIYSNIFVVPKHMAGLCPILNLNNFIHYMQFTYFWGLLSAR